MSCRLVEYSPRCRLLLKFFHENSEGSLSCSDLFFAGRYGLRNLRVAKKVTTRIARMDNTMMTICDRNSQLELGAKTNAQTCRAVEYGKAYHCKRLGVLRHAIVPSPQGTFPRVQQHVVCNSHAPGSKNTEPNVKNANQIFLLGLFPK